MGLFNKVKKICFGLFEDDSEPKIDNLKEEVFFEEKPKHKEEVKKNESKKDEMEDIINERELFRSDTTFKFPVIFEEEDFVAVKNQSRNTNVLNMETTRIKEQIKKETKEDPKKHLFRLSPIISPVYGVLDKNYQKEDIMSKAEDEQPQKKEKKIDFDMIHKKAYGTLSDVIENNIEDEDNAGMFFNLKETKPIKEDNLLSDMGVDNEDILVIEEDIIINDKENDYENFGIDYLKSEEKPVEDNSQDLFNLIDSMYDDKEEEN